MSGAGVPRGVIATQMAEGSPSAARLLKQGVGLVVWGGLSLGLLALFLNGFIVACAAIPCAMVGVWGIIMCCVAAVRSQRASMTIAGQSLRQHHIRSRLAELRWPGLRLRGRPQAVEPVREVAEQGIRAIVDAELTPWVSGWEIPGGLMEPMAILRSREPRGGLGYAASGCMLILVMLVTLPTMIGVFGYFIGPRLGTGLAFGLVLLSVLGFAAQHAGLQRRLVDIPVVNMLVRCKVGRRGLVVGPGWARSGERVWHVGRDLLLIRSVRRQDAHVSVEVMLAGAAGRQRLALSGVGDPSLDLLWMGWMCPEVRPDLARSALTTATMGGGSMGSV